MTWRARRGKGWLPRNKGEGVPEPGMSISSWMLVYVYAMLPPSPHSSSAKLVAMYCMPSSQKHPAQDTRPRWAWVWVPFLPLCVGRDGQLPVWVSMRLSSTLNLTVVVGLGRSTLRSPRGSERAEPILGAAAPRPKRGGARARAPRQWKPADKHPLGTRPTFRGYRSSLPPKAPS